MATSSISNSPGTIVESIQIGANTLAQVKEATKACTGDQCEKLNPSGVCCAQDILELIMEVDLGAAKQFKTYLDTILINIPSKEKKYKPSIYFDHEDIRDIEFQGCVIVFFIDRAQNKYVILGITSKS